MRKTFRVLAGIVFLVLTALVLGTLMPRPLLGPLQAKVPDAAPSRHVLVFTNPIHTDIAIPIDSEVLERFAFLRDNGMQVDLPAARYIVFGWGSKTFYIGTPTWSELKPGPVFAAFTLDSSVMHVDLAGDIALPQPTVNRYDVSEQGFDALLGFIEASFTRGPNGPQIIPGVAYGAFDAFFEANGKFNAFAGCNTWTAAALREAGLTTGWWNPLPVTLNWSLGLYNAPSAAQPGGVQP